MGDVRWGILGSGAMAGLFAEGLTFARGARLHAVASRSGGRARELAARFGAPRAHDDYRRLLEDPEVDVVYVATPNEHHQEHCLLAIAAGKAVLCEKPFALDAGEARAVVAAARRRGVFCMEGMWMRFSPAVREALSVARGGALGDLRLLTAQLGFPYEPDPRSRLFTPPGGGALLDLGVYPLSLAQALFGPPVRVSSAATMAPSGVDDQFSAVLEYSRGRQALVAASLGARLANAASIHGSRGVLGIEEPLYFPHRYRLLGTAPHRPMRQGAPGRLARLRQRPWARSLAELRGRLRLRHVVRRAAGNGYECEAEEVGRCLRAGLGESPEMPLDDTVAVLETMDAIRRQWSSRG